MEQHNQKLAEILREMALRYEFEGSKHHFRARSYEQAAAIIQELPQDVAAYEQQGQLEAIKGIGESIAKKIREYLHTGVIGQLETLRKKLPLSFIALVEVQGLGTETLCRLHEELGIDSREGLEKALKDGSIEKLEGFGPKKVSKIIAGLQQHAKALKTMRLGDALTLGNLLLSHIRDLKGVHQAELAGSLRRCKETVGDIDILIAADKKDWAEIIEAFVHLPGMEEILARGETKVSVKFRSYHRQVDLRLVEKKYWGASWIYFTGSKEHNIRLRKLALEKGLKLSEYGFSAQDGGENLEAGTEKEVYKHLGLAWIPPEMRENLGEIELALQQQIPPLVRLKDIRGDMHMHSRYSDGRHTLEEIAAFVRDNYPYEYIVITDHTKSTRVAGGMDEKGFEKQIKAIQALNKELGAAFIKTGAEVDILPDGSLDLSDELLSQLDWVVASIHAQFNRDNTDRLLSACQHPYVHVLGHPSGRLINARDPYPVEMEEVIKAAKATGTAIEINAQPKRLDLSDRWARRAREEGVALVIDTDSHRLDNFQLMQLGVGVARRAWCTAKDILNTRSWEQLVAFKEQKMKLSGR